ncbi:MAG: PaaI family thioesterase [Sphingomonas sp.]|nr:PaaI family thioesterase [Sphingomonas sp.]
MRHLGAQLVEASSGRCIIEVPLSEALMQQHGFFHAGVSAAIADTASGYAALSLMPDNASVLTVEFKINLLNPADGRLLRATAQVLKPGRTLMVVSASVDVLKGQEVLRCAEFLGTVFTLRNTKDDGSFAASGARS